MLAEIIRTREVEQMMKANLLESLPASEQVVITVDVYVMRDGLTKVRLTSTLRKETDAGREGEISPSQS